MCAKKATWSKNEGARHGEATGKNAIITIENGCFAGLEIKLVKSETTLGSEIACDICLDHEHVSERHAVIRRRGDEFVLEDRRSRRGTRLNGHAIDRATLHGGDTISIGAFDLKFSR